MRKVISKSTIILFAAVMLMTGCKNEKEQIFKLDIPEFTGEDKTTFGSGNTTLWAPGDPVLINSTTCAVQSNGTITVNDPVEAVNRMFYSLYAGRATNGTFNGENGYTLTMPNSYTYNANELKATMLGVCEYNDHIQQHTIRYANVCTLLKLEFVTIPDQVVITSANTAINGDFSYVYNGEDWVATAPAPTTANKTLTINNPSYASVLYIPLPAGNHQLTIVGKTFTKAMARAVEMQKGVFYPIKCAHAFSVSASRKVFFSPGNFEYKNTSTYFTDWVAGPVGGNNGRMYTEDGTVCARFALNQWDRKQANNRDFRNVTGLFGTVLATYAWPKTDGAWIDLFGWGTGTIPGYNYATAVGTSAIIAYDDFNDWGTFYGDRLNANSHTTGSWFTMNQGQWSYLLNLTNNAMRSGKSRIGSVNGVPGLIIAPDDYSGSLPASITSTNWVNDYQKHGVVFLPSGGCMDYQPAENWSWGFISSTAGYWTSNEYNDRQAYYVKIPEGASGNPSIQYGKVNQSLTNNGNKPAKLSVRLVQYAN